VAHEEGAVGNRPTLLLDLFTLPRALGGPNKIWAHNPKLAKVSGPFGAHCHAGHYSISEREREIAVCIITSKWHSACPSNAHERRGKEVGLPTDMVEALIEGLQTSFSDEREQVIYEMAAALAHSRRIPKGLYDGAVKHSAKSASPTRSL
jgi:4-carboxymuconolactone decarboxylase